MRRYVVEITTSVRVLDEEGRIVASRSGDRSVAVDIRGRDRDLIVKQVSDEVAEDMANEMPVFAQNVLRVAGEQQTQ